MDKAAAFEIYGPAAREVLAAFPIEPADLVFVNLSENLTFRVSDARDGAPYVLRLHRPGYHEDAALHSEPVWTAALAAAGIFVPQPVAARGGGYHVPVTVAQAGERRWAGLARWIEGEVLADLVDRETDPAVIAGHFERLGALMAALHNQAAAWTPPAGFHRHSLDAEGLMGEAPFWGPFWDHPVFDAEERALMLQTRDAIRAALIRLGRDPSTFSVIHADLHPGNVLVGEGDVAVIDFDDTAFGWHAYDLAVALVFYQDHAHYADFRDALVRGYRTVRPLDDAVVGLLPMFLLIRRMVQIGWLHQRPELGTPADLPARKDIILALARAFQAPC